MGYDFGDVKLEPCTNLFVGKKRFDLIIHFFFFSRKKKKIVWYHRQLPANTEGYQILLNKKSKIQSRTKVIKEWGNFANSISLQPITK